MIPAEKLCPECEQVKPAGEFGTRLGGACLQSYCRKCHAAKNSKYASKLRIKYGMTLEDYEQLAEDQGNRCAICKSESGGRLCVDHIHNSDRTVRGLLCSACNRALGGFGDSPKNLATALLYLLEKGFAGKGAR